MNTHHLPPEDPRASGFLAKPLGFAAGAGAGVVLWAIITLTTGNMLLGLLFGLAPGIAIGLALQLTARR